MTTKYVIEIRVVGDNCGVVCKIGVDDLSPTIFGREEFFSTEVEALQYGTNFVLELLKAGSVRYTSEELFLSSEKVYRELYGVYYYGEEQ